MNLGLIGKSLSHSFSKSYLEEKFIKENKFDFMYSNFDLENLDTFPELVLKHRLSGLNVTKPYKERDSVSVANVRRPWMVISSDQLGLAASLQISTWLLQQ